MDLTGYRLLLAPHGGSAFQAGLRLPPSATLDPTNLSQAVSPLVIDADGTVVPLTYGFPRPYQLGNLYDAPLRELAHRWIGGEYQAYRAIVNRLFEEEVWSTRKLPVLNLYEAAASIADNGTPAIR